MTKSWFIRLAALCFAAVAWLAPAAALAVGQVKWKSTKLEESNGSWTIDIEMHLPKAPDIAHVPMRFVFQPEVYYERSLLDGQEGPQLRKVPLENRQPLIQSVDVGFMDAGRGEIQKRTRFSFKITRAHSFEAGEYKVTIKDSRNDATVGNPTRLILEGENEIIDRRAMVFSGEKKKKKEDEEKKEDKGADGETEGTSKPLDDPEDPAFWEGGPTESNEDNPQTIEEKPGGCGCRVGGAAPSAAPVSLLLVALVLGIRRRRA